MCLQAITIKPLMKLILIKVNLLFLLHQLTKHNNAKAGIAAILLALSSKLAKIRVAPIEVAPISTHSKTLQSSRFCFGSWEGEGGRGGVVTCKRGDFKNELGVGRTDSDFIDGYYYRYHDYDIVIVAFVLFLYGAVEFGFKGGGVD